MSMPSIRRHPARAWLLPVAALLLLIPLFPPAPARNLLLITKERREA